MERLQKVIASAGIASRRKAEQMIVDGLVKVNGVVVTELGTKVGKKDQVLVNNQPLNVEEKVYYVINKPKKTICSSSDEHARTTVTSLIDAKERLFTVGRLDYETTGVLIVTNDGEFANELTHPRFHIAKTYEMTIGGILEASAIKLLERGVTLDDGSVTLPAKAWITHKDFEKKQTSLELTIVEGRNRQVKRMLEAVGHEVRRLHRKSIAFLLCNDLAYGEYRRLKPFEIKQLRHLANEGNGK
jgi:23S rRNA pseudouridine2605 synthase